MRDSWLWDARNASVDQFSAPRASPATGGGGRNSGLHVERRFWRVTLLGNRPSLSLAREPSDGLMPSHIRSSDLSLSSHFPCFISNSPFTTSQQDALSHPLLAHAATSIVNAMPRPLAPSSSPAVPIAPPTLTPLAAIRTSPLRLARGHTFAIALHVSSTSSPTELRSFIAPSERSISEALPRSLP